jgi:cytidine deaminase
VLDNGAVICGNNQENIAYPSGMCAERVALFYANATHPTSNVNTLVIVAQGNLVKPDMCISPCGSCRQVIAESESRQKEPITIILVAQNGETWIFHSINDLLIFPFGVSDKNE